MAAGATCWTVQHLLGVLGRGKLRAAAAQGEPTPTSPHKQRRRADGHWRRDMRRRGVARQPECMHRGRCARADTHAPRWQTRARTPSCARSTKMLSKISSGVTEKHYSQTSAPQNVYTHTSLCIPAQFRKTHPKVGEMGNCPRRRPSSGYRGSPHPGKTPEGL